MKVLFYFLLCGYSATSYRPRTEYDGRFCFYTCVSVHRGGGSCHWSCQRRILLDNLGGTLQRGQGKLPYPLPQTGQGSQSDSRQDRPPDRTRHRQETPSSRRRTFLLRVYSLTGAKGKMTGTASCFPWKFSTVSLAIF